MPSLSIRPFATTNKYNGPTVDLQQAGREMRVTDIITGHYLKSGDQLQMTLEAVDVENNRALWRDTLNVAALDMIQLDAGSEWAFNSEFNNLLREGKVSEAREILHRFSSNPFYDGDFLEACLQPEPPADMDKIAYQVEVAVLAETDPEPQYFRGAIMAFCGQKGIALRLLKTSIGRNYCAYSALQSDPLLAKLRSTPEFDQLLSAGKQCQDRFLKERKKKPPENSGGFYSGRLRRAYSRNFAGTPALRACSFRSSSVFLASSTAFCFWVICCLYWASSLSHVAEPRRRLPASA